jgi:hypothetical protein
VIPDNYKLLGFLETYINQNTGEIVILGDPLDGHNCDELGCGSVGPHVMARFRLTPLAPDAACTPAGDGESSTRGAGEASR